MRAWSRTHTGELVAALGTAATLAASLVVPAGVDAAQPVRGARYSACDGSGCNVGFAVTRGGGYVTGFFALARCAPGSSLDRMRIDHNGAFSFRGQSRSVTVTVTGRFTSPSLATGSVRFQHGRCDSGTVRWRAALGLPG